MEPTGTCARLLELVNQVKAAFTRLITPVAAQLGLTPMQMLILLRLYRNGPVSVGGLCRQLDMNQGNISTQCKRLEQAGFLHRTRSAQDERVVTLELTEKGQEAAICSLNALNEFNNTVDQLPPPLLESALSGLEALTQILNSAPTSR